ncbi:hypothetical protein RhiirA5_363611 [Rhizophagus irregularis]|uniref:Uncharacterized protein n=1 Tax=Rhizophagus irregularis TaxID=588596 RepID=A0A2N0P868_9GLOM|nr:hypothetical protein RhiirA5_363611 [Rhizophagus irregularis]PKC61498.1 hypothetical protein RhiirA1_424795 [Rhizophagus irregularis]
MVFNWDYLFEILVSSSSPNLFKFKFYFYEAPKLESLKLFLDNWKGRRSILLQTIQDNSWGLGLEIGMKYFELMEEYKMQGIILNGFKKTFNLRIILYINKKNL